MTPTQKGMALTFAGVAALAFTLLVQGAFTNPHTGELAVAESECGYDLDIGTQRYQSQGAFIVFESREEPTRYAVVEKSWSGGGSVPVRPRRVFCDVDERYWEQPETWDFTGRTW